jgi:soluble lytic murein transglycosylase-like protein
VGKRWWWVAVGVVVVGAWAARGDDTPAPQTATSGEPRPSITPSPSASTTPATEEWFENYDPARFAPQVRTYASRAGIHPQLLMAILYNESYKPHDPDLERSWAKIDSDPAFGIANMHRAAFDDTKRGRAFAVRKWEELPDDPELAIEAAAWHLHDLAKRLPASRNRRFSKDELLALGYNTGAGNMRAFAKGANPGRQAQSYLDRLHDNWDKSAKAVRSSR